MYHYSLVARPLQVEEGVGSKTSSTIISHGLDFRILQQNTCNYCLLQQNTIEYRIM